MTKRNRTRALILIVLMGMALAVVLAIVCEKKYECTVDFDFVDSAAVTLPLGPPPKDPESALVYEMRKEAEDRNRRTIADNRTEDFRRYLSWSCSRNEWMKYIQDPYWSASLGDVDTNCLERVLSGAVFEIVRMPRDNFVYGCRIRFAPCTDGNISRIARSCMDVLSNFVADMNEVNVYRAAYEKFQELRKRERRILQLEKSADADVDGSVTSIELIREREAVQELGKSISAVRKQVLGAGEKRITNVVIRTAVARNLPRLLRCDR